MQLDILVSNQFLMQSVRQNLGLESADDSQDERIAKMSSGEILERFLNWNNIVGYGRTFANVYRVLTAAAVAGKLNLDKLSEEDNWDIVETLRKRGELPDWEDTNFKEEDLAKYVASLSPTEAFGEYLAWNGILGFAEPIGRAIETLNQAKE